MCYGILLYCNTFSSREIRIITGNRAFSAVLPRLFKRAFGFGFDKISEKNDEWTKQSFVIDTPDKISAIFAKYGYESSSVLAHHVNLGVLEEDCCRLSFLKGVFLAGGSVTDPGKRYHFELVTDHKSVSRETYSLLLELGFSPRETVRGAHSVVYFKQSDVISDILALLGAPLASMEVVSAKIEKDIMNSVNRKVNCDTANVRKTVDASHQLVMAINALQKADKLTSLPEQLQETARLRVENPEMSISQLAEIHVPPVTKSCLNHRLRKISALAAELSET